MAKYKITFEQCLKQIGKGDVCEGCGGKLEPIKTVDNSDWPTFWVGCKHCMCFRGGIKKEYWEIARRLIKEDMLIPYSHMHKSKYEDTPERLAYYLDSQTAGLSWNIGYIHRLLKEKFEEESEMTDKEKIIELKETIQDLRLEADEYQKKLDEIDSLALQAGTSIEEIRTKI